MATSLRRSGRVRDQHQKVQPTRASASSTEATPIKRKPNNDSKRRKTEEKPSEDERVPAESLENVAEGPQPVMPDKRVRRQRGLLKFMTETPLDTLHEIFRELEPADLLHLSWSSKSLNSIIMERSAWYIWKEAYERLHESENSPPCCPDDITLAHYAKFLFGKNCLICGAVHGFYTSWVLRLRACWKCLNNSKRFQSVDHSDLSCVLTISAKKQDFCLKDDWLEYVQSTTDPALHEERQKLRALRQKDMGKFNNWEGGRSRDHRAELQQIRLQRKAEILSRLSELGWPVPWIEEITNNSINNELPGFKKAKKLGTHEWKELQPKILKRLEELQNVCLDEKRKKKLRERWLAFEYKFVDWHRARAIQPYWRPLTIDIGTVDPFRSIIFKPSLEDAVFDIDEIDRAATAWMNSRSDLLISLLPQDLRASVVTVAEDGRLMLPHLACILFKKPKQPKGRLSRSAGFCTLSDICQHRRRFRDEDSALEDNEFHHAISSISSYSCSHNRPWDWDFQTFGLEFDEKAHIVAKNVLQNLFGLNPLETTLLQMQERALKKFRCTQCPRYSHCLGIGKNWLQIIEHEMRHEFGDISITTRWLSTGGYD